MALYVLAFDSALFAGGECTVIVDGRDAVDEKIKQWHDEQYMEDGEWPVVYQLGKKMQASMEVKITLKGE